MDATAALPSHGLPEEAPRPMVSVVIPTFRREGPLVKTIRYFLEQETYAPFELFVVDQTEQHEPETEAFLRENAARFQHVRATYRSVTRARNDGVQRARGDIIVFVDDDVAPAPGFLAGHVAPYVDPEVLGVTGPAPGPGQRLLSREEVPDTFWADLEREGVMRFDLDFAFDAAWALGANMSFRRSAILRVGGFDENFFGIALGEECEFSERILRSGGRIRYEPRAHLVHEMLLGGHRHASQYTSRLMASVANMVYLWSRVGDRRVRWAKLARVFYGSVFGRDCRTNRKCHVALWWFLRGLCTGLRLRRQPSLLPFAIQS